MILQHPSTASKPDISILMTAFNSERYLAEALESVLAQQTWRTWELLFVDDGSTDATLALARRYASLLPNHIRTFQHPAGRNCGISASRNLALRHANAPLLTFLDSDDVWLPHHLERQAALLDRSPRVALVYAAAERWVDFEEPFQEAKARNATWGSNYLPPLLPPGQRDGLLPRGALLDWFRADEGLVPCTCTVMVRTAVARAVGGFCNDFRGLYDDQAFYAKIILGHDVVANDTPVARYRQHADSCCGRSRQQPGLESKERLRFDAFVRECSREPHLKAAALHDRAEACAAQ